MNLNNIELLDACRRKHVALTFDDITLEDKPSSIHPNNVSVGTYITKTISLKSAGIMSAAMDTVTEKELALAMAKMGGVGIIHRNMSPQSQADMVRWVRQSIHRGGMIERPVTFFSDQYLSDLQHNVKTNGWTFTSFPILSRETNKLVGLVTRHEMEFLVEPNPRLGDIMIPQKKVFSVREKTTSIDAYKIMNQYRIKKLPIIDADDMLVGMYVWNDVREDNEKKDLFSLDDEGHFLVGAAIGFGQDDFERAKTLVYSAGCKLLVLDSSHGACEAAKIQLTNLRQEFGSSVQIIVGNIASYDSAKYLLEGEYIPDALKVGIGPGSICTTRVVSGHGVPQLTAIYEVWRAVQHYYRHRSLNLDHITNINNNRPYIGIIADGGIRNSGDIVKALAAGADGVMVGSLLAGTDEAPGRIIEVGGRSYKTIRGMGSRGALADQSGSRARYMHETTTTEKPLPTSADSTVSSHEGSSLLECRPENTANDNAASGHAAAKSNETPGIVSTTNGPSQSAMSERLTEKQQQKIVPEGVQGLVEYKGRVSKVIMELVGGVQSGLAHSGVPNVHRFRRNATMWRQSPVGLAEGRPHDLMNIIH